MGLRSRTRRLRISQNLSMDMPSAAFSPRPRVFLGNNKKGRILMLKFYFNGAPNPNKVALFLEESGLPYELVPVDTRKGDQFKPEFLKVNPNGKVPAIDDDGVFVFDSNAILLYLAEKTGKFPNVKRLVDEISARPAAPRAIALKDKFTFKAEMDDEARNFMFRHLKTKAA